MFILYICLSDLIVMNCSVFEYVSYIYTIIYYIFIYTYVPLPVYIYICIHVCCFLVVCRYYSRHVDDNMFGKRMT